MIHPLDTLDAFLPDPGDVLLLEAERGRERRGVLHAWLERQAASGAKGWLLECDFEEGGPWSGLKDIFEDLFPRLAAEAPDLIARHDYELVTILPALRRQITPRYLNLTDLAHEQEQVRLYPADRAQRILHGLIDLLAAWKTRCDPTPWVIVCDDLDRAGHLVRRFFPELLRRRGLACGLSLLAAIRPGSMAALASEFYRPPRCFRLACKPSTDRSIPPVDARAQASALEASLNGDPIVTEIHLASLVRLWSVSDMPERALPWQAHSFVIYTARGFYLDALIYGEAALHHLERFHPGEDTRRFRIANKLFACHCTAGHPERALALVEGLLDKLSEPRTRALGHYILAMLHARYLPERDLGRATEHLELGLEELGRAGLSAADFHFQFAFNRNGLALVRHRQGDAEGAIALCRDALCRLNTHLDADQHRLHRSVLLYNIAQVYSAIGRLTEAISYYTSAIAMDPHYSEYYNERGNLFHRQGLLQEAFADYQQAIELSPPFPEVWANLGQCERKLGHLDRAIASLSRSLDLAPNQPDVLVARAECYESTDDVDAALADYAAALALNSEQPLLFSNRACLLYQRGRLAEALADLDRALQGSPGTADLYRNRSTVLIDLGRLEEAREDLETYLQLAPQAEDRKEIEEQVGSLRQGPTA